MKKILIISAFFQTLIVSCIPCTPMTFISASYWGPSEHKINRIISTAKYTPKDAFLKLHHDIEANNQYNRNGEAVFTPKLGELPLPIFTIIDGHYFFVTHYTCDKLGLPYIGWKFNELTGEYQYVRKDNVRLFYSCEAWVPCLYKITDNDLGFAPRNSEISLSEACKVRWEGIYL